MYQNVVAYLFFSVVSLIVSPFCFARVVTTEPIVCQGNIQELQQNASTAYLVELSNVENGTLDEPQIGINGILYSPAQMTILKVYRDPTGALARLKGQPQKAILARLCDSAHNEKNNNCLALQTVFEDKQRWVLFDTYSEDGKIHFTLRDCPAASFMVESDEHLKAWEESYIGTAE